MSERPRLPILLAILLIPLSADAGFGITIRFHARVAVTKPFIQLGDIAEITGGSPELRSAYAQARIAPTPPAGGRCILDFDTIRTRMIALGLSTGELEFTGQSQVLIENSAMATGTTANSFAAPSDSPNLSPADLAMIQAKRIVLQAVRSALASSLEPGDLVQAEVLIDISPQSAGRFQGTSASDWTITGWQKDLNQRQYLLFNAKHGTQRTEPIPVVCVVKIPPRVLSVNKVIPAGHMVTTADLDWVYSREAGGETQVEEILGMETARTLRPGQPIQPDDLRKKPYVRSRDLVSVRARQGGVTVQCTMRALGTGGLGEIVTFVNLDGKEKIAARVTGYHEAEVVEPR